MKFIDYLEAKGLASRTIKEYTRLENRFEKLLEDSNDLKQATILLLQLHPNQPSVRAFLRNFFECFDIYDVKIPAPTGRKKKRLVKPLSKDEVEKLALAMYRRDEKYGLLFLVFYYGALRLEEIFGSEKIPAIKSSNIEKNRLRIVGKGNKERLVLLPRQLAGDLFEYLIRHKENLGVKKRQFQIILRKVSFETIYRYVHPHLLRHTRATHLRNDGIEIEDVKNYLGHSSISTTEIYLHRDIEKSLENIENLEKK